MTWASGMRQRDCADLLLIIARIGERFLLILPVRLAELSIFHGTKLLHFLIQAALLCHIFVVEIYVFKCCHHIVSLSYVLTWE